MATLAALFRNAEENQAPAAAAAPAARAPRDLFELRALPMESLVFYSKPINNTRLVREADPRSRGACWSAIGGAALVCGLLFGVLAPNLANTLYGYKLDQLHRQQQELMETKHTLEFAVAESVSPEKLERYAMEENLVTPAASQVTRLDGKPGDALAMAAKQ